MLVICTACPGCMHPSNIYACIWVSVTMLANCLKVPFVMIGCIHVHTCRAGSAYNQHSSKRIDISKLFCHFLHNYSIKLGKFDIFRKRLVRRTCLQIFSQFEKHSKIVYLVHTCSSTLCLPFSFYFQSGLKCDPASQMFSFVYQMD